MKGSDILGQLEIGVPGHHNVLNALAAVATAHELEVPFEKIADSLREFRGVVRRFEIKGTVDDIMVIDDYAHHPTEILATLNTAKNYYNRRVIAVFQPHLFSRTRQFYREFAQALQIADEAYVVDIYPAREEPIEGVNSEMISAFAREKGLKPIGYLGSWDEAADQIIEKARPGDMIINIGAGSIYRINPIILQKLKER
jgi:UDP-N-acetylmuramate--alanine ligase